MKCQPILFIGSGISKRYYGGPSWEELLRIMARQCPLIDKEFAYYKQSAMSDGGNVLISIGDKFAQLYYEWAWNEGKGEFPPELFTDDNPSEIYLKYKIAEYFNTKLQSSLAAEMDSNLSNEIDLLKKIHPHAIITTNYDTFLETIFPEYEPIIGQKILRSNYTSYGEILKIHGCVSNPEGIVLNKNDYDDFEAKKKYLTAKLLTYFAEHPLLFAGYSAEDPNIKSILSDIDEIVSTRGEVIPNIYILEWNPSIDTSIYPLTEKIIPIAQHKNVRVKCIEASSFEWVFKAFLYAGEIKNVDVKILRSLLARTYELVRTDIPREKLEIDYETLGHYTSSREGIATLYGISIIDDPRQMNVMYPYTLTQVSEKLGHIKKGKGIWQKSHQLIQTIKTETGIDIQVNDNSFHVNIRTGEQSATHKYSERMVTLLRKVMNNQDYSDELSEFQEDLG